MLIKNIGVKEILYWTGNPTIRVGSSVAKAGRPWESEPTARSNGLLEIQKELQPDPRFAGIKVLYNIEENIS